MLIQVLTSSARSIADSAWQNGRPLNQEAGASARRKEKLARTRNKKAWEALLECEQATPEELLDGADPGLLGLPGLPAVQLDPLSLKEEGDCIVARAERAGAERGAFDDVGRHTPKV